MSRKKKNRAGTEDKRAFPLSTPGCHISNEPACMPATDGQYPKSSMDGPETHTPSMAFSGHTPHRGDRTLLKDVPPVAEMFPCHEELEYRVQVKPAVWDELMEHSRENAGDSGRSGRVELCGVLVGRNGADVLGPFLLVEHSIRGVGAKNEGAQVTFTHATWDHIHHEMDTRFPEGKIVGWYHTHPGFGIFLSDMDTFIQENFFNQPFQVALVIDPVSEVSGMFAWVNARIQPLSRCWVGSERRPLTKGSVGNVTHKTTTGHMVLRLENEPKNHVPATDGQYLKSSMDGMFLNGIGFDVSAKPGPLPLLASKDLAILVVVFLAGMLISLWGLRYVWQNGFREEARSQIREMMALLAGETSRKNDLAMIDDRLTQVQKDLAALSKPASETSPGTDGQYPKSATDGTLLEGVPAKDGQYPKCAMDGAFTEGVYPHSDMNGTRFANVREEVGLIRLLIANLASSTVLQEGRVRAALSGQSADGLTLNERLARLNEELAQMRAAVAMGYFLQVKLLLAGMDPNNPDPAKTKIGRQIMQFALTISPILESNFRQDFPWLFNPVAGPSGK